MQQDNSPMGHSLYAVADPCAYILYAVVEIYNWFLVSLYACHYILYNWFLVSLYICMSLYAVLETYHVFHYMLLWTHSLTEPPEMKPDKSS